MPYSKFPNSINKKQGSWRPAKLPRNKGLDRKHGFLKVLHWPALCYETVTPEPWIAPKTIRNKGLVWQNLLFLKTGILQYLMQRVRSVRDTHTRTLPPHHLHNRGKRDNNRSARPLPCPCSGWSRGPRRKSCPAAPRHQTQSGTRRLGISVRVCGYATQMSHE